MKNIFKLNILGLLLVLVFIVISGCKKFLEEKSKQNLAVITKLKDMQALLDDYNTVVYDEPSALEISADDYYLSYNDWKVITEFDRRKYLWEENIYPNTENEWAGIYRRVYRANLVLDNIEGVDHSVPMVDLEWGSVKGQALFLRARSFFSAVLTWSVAYDSSTASTDLGIPLRLSSVFSDISERGTTEETYNRIIADLKEAIPLLPPTPVHVFRASRPAAQAMLARTYMAMRKYDSCLVYANACLQTNNYLYDYKSAPEIDTMLATLNSYAFGKPAQEALYATPSKEVIYACRMAAAALAPSRARIDSNIYRAYLSTDLRKKLFFRTIAVPAYGFRGSYAGSSPQFCGVGVDEVYLMRAECCARLESTSLGDALGALDTFMRKRSYGNYVSITAVDKNDALQKILLERRKELIFRGLRWMDIKRLNKHGANIVLKRVLDSSGVVMRTAELLPNSPKYALPIPGDIISLTGMQQNPR